MKDEHTNGFEEGNIIEVILHKQNLSITFIPGPCTVIFNLPCKRQRENCSVLKEKRRVKMTYVLIHIQEGEFPVSVTLPQRLRTMPDNLWTLTQIRLATCNTLEYGTLNASSAVFSGHKLMANRIYMYLYRSALPSWMGSRRDVCCVENKEGREAKNGWSWSLRW